jgi:transaldolase
VIIASVARPDYVNVFLGRIGAFIMNNKLGDGSGAGEKAVISSQNWITGLSAQNPWQTKLIAASLRSYNQLELLAGTDVFTMPPKVAAAGRKELSGKFSARTHENYEVNLYSSSADAHIEKFWEVDDKVLSLAERLAGKIPVSSSELIHIAYEEGCEDMFPALKKTRKQLTLTEKSRYSQDGTEDKRRQNST